MSEIINWVRRGNYSDKPYFVVTYDSDNHEQNIKFYSREEYENFISTGQWSYLIDYWNTGDCQITDLFWQPSVSTTHPMWSEVAENINPDSQLYVLADTLKRVIDIRFEGILAEDILQFSFTMAGDFWFAFTTGVVM